MLAPPRAKSSRSDPSSAFFASGVKGGAEVVPVPAASVNRRRASRAGSNSSPAEANARWPHTAAFPHQA